jgi:malonyl-CoA O-methyltransferase
MFDRIAHTYDQHAIVSQKLAEGLFARLDFIKMNPTSILDLGTGTGSCLQPLLTRYPQARLTALDISPRMLAQAQGKIEDQRITWICGDFFENPLQGQAFDLIFANDILPWVDSIAGFFQRCLAALNPGGLILFSGLGVDTLKELKRAGEVSHTGTHVNAFYDIHDIGDALVHLGYTDPVLDLQYLSLTYRHLDGFFKELKGAGSYLHKPSHTTLTGKIRWQRLCEAYEKTAEGLYPATFELVYGHARRGDTIIRRHTPGEPIHIPLSDIKRRRA